MQISLTIVDFVFHKNSHLYVRTTLATLSAFMGNLKILRCTGHALYAKIHEMVQVSVQWYGINWVKQTDAYVSVL